MVAQNQGYKAKVLHNMHNCNIMMQFKPHKTAFAQKAAISPPNCPLERKSSLGSDFAALRPTAAH
jgi:hypothetical protein